MIKRWLRRWLGIEEILDDCEEIAQKGAFEMARSIKVPPGPPGPRGAMGRQGKPGKDYEPRIVATAVNTANKVELLEREMEFLKKDLRDEVNGIKQRVEGMQELRSGL